MSNPAVYLLAETRVNGKVLRIEDNLGEAIHVHVGDFRFSLTVAEFENFYESVLAAAKFIFELRGLDWEMIDLTSLDWEWLASYGDFESITVRNVKIGELYTTRRIHNDKTLSRIVPINKSLMYEVLEGKETDLAEYEEVNMYGQDSYSRLMSVYEKIQGQGYPYDNKYIMIDSIGLIYDGGHRAACLCKIYGTDYVVPVLEIKFINQVPSIKDKIKSANRNIRRRLIKGYIKKILKIPFQLIGKLKWAVVGTMENVNETKIRASGIEVNSRDDLIDLFQKADVKYYLIDNLVIDNSVNIKGTFIVEEDKFSKIRELLCAVSKENMYQGFPFLYSTLCPVVIDVEEGTYAIWDRLCCNSMFEKAILPLDKYCNKLSWEQAKADNNGIICASDSTRMLYILANCILEKQRFDETDIAFIRLHKDVLRDAVFVSMVYKIFFEFTEKLIAMLQKEKYDDIVLSYVTNKEY